MKSKYIKPSIEVWQIHKSLSILNEMSLTGVGVNEYEQDSDERYWENIDLQ